MKVPVCTQTAHVYHTCVPYLALTSEFVIFAVYWSQRGERERKIKLIWL